MELITFIQAVKKYQKVLWYWSIGIVIMMSVLIFAQPLKYGATSELLIVQQYSGGTDPYSISRSNQYLSSMLASVVTSQSFYGEVMNSGFSIDQEYFNTDARIQMKTWEKTVEAKSIGDSGMIEISVFHPDRYQAQQIARAINSTLRLKNGQYRGSGSDLTIKVLNEPIVSVWPVKPNIPLNMILAIVFGLLLVLVHIYGIAIGVIKPKKRGNSGVKIDLAIEKVLEKNTNIVTDQIATIQRTPEQVAPVVEQKIFNQNIDQVKKPEDFRPQGDMGNVFKN